MGYTDKHGRPELVAQPFIKKGTAHARVVDVEDAETPQSDGSGELVVGELVDDPDQSPQDTPDEPA